MEEIALLGNAAAVPIVITITQLLKKHFSFKYKADVVAFAVSLIVCPLWWLYNTPDIEIRDALDGGFLEISRGIINLFLISVGTWLSASKSYDLFKGNKKRQLSLQQEKQSILDQHDSEKQALVARIQELEGSLKSGGSDGLVDENDVSDKLLEILEGRD